MAQDIFGDAIKLLDSLTSVKVFADMVPESYDDTAIALVNLSNPFDRVVKEGKKTGKHGIFRLSLVSSSNSELSSVISELEDLDNTCHAPFFQRIRMDLDFIEAKVTPDQPVRRAFLTYTTYP